MIHFGNDTCTVVLEWSQFRGETYTVTTVPEAMHMTVTGNGSAQLVLLYNNEYNVTVTATLCGHSNATTIRIHYGITVCIVYQIE